MGDSGERPHGVNVARIVEGHQDAAVALISRNQSITYAELRDRVARLRGGLAGLGIVDGDRVAIICGNGHPFVFAYLAVVGLGAVAAPLNPTSPGPELQRELAALGPVAVVVDRTASGRGPTSTAPRVPSIRTVVTVDGDAGDAVARRAAGGRAGAGGRPGARPPRRAPVHQRHRRRAACRDAEPREPARQHRAGAVGDEPRRAR